MEKNVFNDRKRANEYVEMLEGYDNSFIISHFNNNVEKGSKVLELGMGPAIDYEMLRDNYQITVSDTSEAFIEMFREKHNQEALNICVKDIIVEDKFDCIYTNKVLQVLSDEEMKISFINQHRVLENNGMIFHCIWIGEGYEDCTSNYTTVEKIMEMIDGLFFVERIVEYSEIDSNDSIILIAKKC